MRRKGSHHDGLGSCFMYPRDRVVVTYYAQHEGPFVFMRLKIWCIGGTTSECQFYQEHLHNSAIPTYQPMLWWLGLLMLAFWRDTASTQMIFHADPMGAGCRAGAGQPALLPQRRSR
jgi:hypothetical protein